jgi:hypothetical protein
MLLRPFYLIFGTLTAIIGMSMHKSWFWAVIDFLIWPLVWPKWLFYKEVTMSIIKTAFAWFTG